jgi:hypothetical protein
MALFVALLLSVQAQQPQREPSGLSPIEKNGKYGFADKSGKLVIEPQYELAYEFSEGLAAVRINNKFGFIDQTGKFVIEPKYSLTTDFSDGLASVAIGRYPGKWGYIDKLGKLVIPIRYDYALEFSEGLAAVKVGELWGYIDKAGKFSEGLAPVSVGGKWGYVDRVGKIVIALQFDGAAPFVNGAAKVGFGSNCNHCVDLGDPTAHLADVKYIDKTGRYVVPPSK